MIMMSVPAHVAGSDKSAARTPRKVASGPYMLPIRVIASLRLKSLHWRYVGATPELRAQPPRRPDCSFCRTASVGRGDFSGHRDRRLETALAAQRTEDAARASPRGSR